MNAQDAGMNGYLKIRVIRKFVQNVIVLGGIPPKKNLK